ncbi:protein phosphatase CheZ [Azovibrio restrictus]|uniref:protein phosphatase CheZ n=1 Tax=Azovibrio restrictus TaxID=146938 RepID=UPI0026ED8159|nr:protein phosphatase CheZ [Azovibrio restrictus]
MMTASNDSDELEALFDSVAASVAPGAPAVAPAPPAPSAASPSGMTSQGDSDELQALFDSVSANFQPPAPAPEGGGESAGDGQQEWPAQENVFNRIGQMARQLHDTLRELGYDKLLEQTVSTLPDAKDRLAYVANLTEQAACRVLNATDIARPVVDQVESGAKALAERWDKVFANQMSTAEFRRLAEETRQFLKQDLPAGTAQVNGQLMEIMMAQDFQDLTGQVIKKVVSLAQELENGLMAVLIEVVPPKKRSEEVNSLLNGPVISADGRSDVVVNQQQVDDLLESLGF